MANSLATDEVRERARWRAIVGTVLHDISDADACFLELWQHFSSSTNWKLAPGAGALLTELSKERDSGSWATSPLTSIPGSGQCWQAFPRIGCFMISSSAARSAQRKPAAGFFTALCRTSWNCDASEILFVGDSRDNDYDGMPAKPARCALLLDPRGPASERRVPGASQIWRNCFRDDAAKSKT